MADSESEEGSVKREDLEQPGPQEEGDAGVAAEGGEQSASGAEKEEAAEEDGLENSGDVEAEEETVPQPAADDDEEPAAAGAEGGAEEESSGRVEHIPDTGEVAEIVLITTSLGSIRRQFFSSQRTKNFLDCKGVVYVIVDSNRDTSTAKNLRDVELFKEWKENRILKASPETEDSADPESTATAAAGALAAPPQRVVLSCEVNTRDKVIIPQVLVDGVAVGSETTLQDLEEDGDLACPNCLHEKPLSAMQCEACGVVFRTLIPPNYISEGHVLQMLQGCPYNEDEAAAEGGEDQPQPQRWGICSQQSIVADVDFGDLDEEGGNAAAETEDAAATALQAAVKAEAEAEAAARRVAGEEAAAEAESAE